MWAGNVWLFSAALMLMISLGPAGIAWPLMSKLPIVSKVNNNPFRALPYFNIFAVLAGGIIVERLLRPLRHSRRWELAIVSVVALLMLYHASIARPALFAYGDKPYPALPKEMADLLDSTRPTESHRVIGVSQRKCTQPGLALAMVHSFPSVYSVLSYYGDDPLVASKPLFSAGYKRMSDDPLAAAQAYGIRWLLVHKDVMEIYDFYKHPDKLKPEEIAKRNPEEFFITHGVGSPPPYNRIFEPLYQHSRQVLSYPEVEVREIEGPCRPLAFCESAPDVALPIQLSGRGAKVDLGGLSQGGPVVVNFMAWPHMTAKVDGQPVPAGPDEWGRLRVMVPAGAKTLEVRYTPPWAKGMLFGAAIALATAVGAVAARWLLGKSGSKQA